jgi:hypothetical protein
VSSGWDRPRLLVNPYHTGYHRYDRMDSIGKGWKTIDAWKRHPHTLPADLIWKFEHLKAIKILDPMDPDPDPGSRGLITREPTPGHIVVHASMHSGLPGSCGQRTLATIPPNLCTVHTPWPPWPRSAWEPIRGQWRKESETQIDFSGFSEMENQWIFGSHLGVQ